MSKADRQAQMLEVAERVFAERGYLAASMDDIAEEVGVSKPMLYEYFGSKEGLLAACIAKARTDLLDVTREAITEAKDAEDVLWLGLVAFFRFIDSRGSAWTVLRHEASLAAGPAAAEIEAIRRQQTDFIAAMMSAFVPTADVRELEAYAALIVGGSERLALWREQRGGITPEEAARYQMDLTWGGLTTLVNGATQE